MKSVLFVCGIMFSLGAWAYPTGKVQWGGEPEMDACGAFGYTMATTVMITRDAKGFISFDKVIPAGTPVTFCDYDSGFHGVLIHKEGIDCGGGSATVPDRRPYDGPCESGWIKETFLELVAG